MFNTEDLYDLVCDEILVRRGKRFSLELKLQMMGRKAEDAWNILRRECDIADPWQFLQTEADRIFEKLLPEKIEKLPGLDQLLEAIEERGLPKAVATSSRRAFAERAIGHFGLLEKFEFLLTGEDVSQAKPHPEIYWRAAAKLGTSCPQMLVFEDSFKWQFEKIGRLCNSCWFASRFWVHPQAPRYHRRKDSPLSAGSRLIFSPAPSRYNR